MRGCRTVLSLFLFLGAALLAQSDRGTLTGTIGDPAGAVVANAAIQAKNTSTGVLYEAASTATGNYTLPELPAGDYELSVTVPGFKKYVRQGLTVQAAQTYRIDVALEVGAATESITVSEETPLLKTESGELGHNVTGSSLDALPVLGIGSQFASNSGVRNPMAATYLLPGGQFTGDTTVRVNGTPQNTESIRVEGQESSNATMMAFGSQNQPSVDSIQEFQVQTSNYAAEFGQTGGVVFIATMKSGTNNLDGTLYDYFVNDALNAASPFVNAKQRAHRNDYGFTLGGPVKIPKLYDGRNRTFFFYNFEQFRENTVVNNVPLTVPTDPYRAGNFSTAFTGRTLGTDPLGRPILEGAIYDPNTNTVAPSGQVVRSVFPGNVIPASRLDPVSVAIQSLIPQPNLPGLVNNYLVGYTGIRHTDINSVKVDQIVTSKSKLSVFYSRTQTYSPYSQTLAGDSLPAEITVGRGNYDWVHTTRANYDYTITPTLLYHLGLGYVNQHGPNDYTPAMDSFNPASVGLKGTLDTGRFPSFQTLCNQTVAPGASNPAVCGGTGGMVNMGPTTAGGAPGAITGGGIYSFRPTGNSSLTWIKGNHTFKAGTELVINNFMYSQDYPGEGQFNFGAGETGLPYLAPATTVGGGTPGFPYASFLLGAADSATIGSPTDTHFRTTLFGLFLQDSWKITRKLTFDYGLRYDYQTYLNETEGRMPDFSQTVLNPSAGNLPGGLIYNGGQAGHCQCNIAHNYPFAFGPRLGGAYQITPKTVFRAGFGVVYAKPGSYDNFTVTDTSPIVSPGLFTPALYLQNGITTQASQWPNLNPGQYPNVPGQIANPTPAGVYLIDPNAGRPPRLLQWSVGIQREVTRDFVVEASYVGNRGAYWAANGFAVYNAITPARLAAAGLNINNPANLALLALPLSSPQVQAAGFTAPYAGYPLCSKLAQALRPFPQFGNIGGYRAPLGDTWYNSMQFKATKRLSHGLEAMYSLTWQKSLTEGAESEGTGGGAINDAFNRAVNKDISQFDQPQVSILSVSYSTPSFVHGGGASSKALGWLTRDWNIGTLLSYRSGLPIQAPTSSTNPALSNLLFQCTFVNRNPGVPLFTQNLNCHCFDPNATFVLNPAAWSQPAIGQFGSSAAYYTDYRYQRRPQENVNLGRTFRVKERATFTIRGEFTNIFNRTEMSNPTATNSLATQTKTAAGQTTGGFGYINNGTTFGLPRQGSIVARIQF